MHIATLAERPDLAAALRSSELEPGPEFIYHDPVGKSFWPRLATDFPEYQIMLLDGDRVIAKGSCIPWHWTGPDADLPQAGWDFVLAQGCADRDAGHEPTAASALAIVVAEDRLGQGLSRVVLEGMRDAVAAQGLPVLFAPVRPTFKARYPLIPMDRYIDWTHAGGEQAPFDPWLRVHWRVGGRVLHPCRESMVITGSVADWERWTGLALPSSGEYVVEGALVPVSVDRERDVVRYVEPNVWVRHDIAAPETPGRGSGNDGTA